jgi:hypothetical protein
MNSYENERLSWWQVLEAEYLFLRSNEPKADARKGSDGPLDEPRQPLDELAQPAAEDDLNAAEAARIACSRMHSGRFSALCLSGGGIRSATLSLGVIEALSHHSCVGAQSGELSLLGEIDYLSTVSGGGYIGSWLSSWIYRDKGVSNVVRQLSQSTGQKLNPEPEPVRRLRSFSNYLSPRLGVASADTWTLVATVIRNILLNWLVLLPFLAFLLMIPRLLLVGVHHAIGGIYLLAMAGLLGAMSVAFAAVSIPSASAENTGQPWFIALCLVPMTLAAIWLSFYVALKWHRAAPNWPLWWYSIGAISVLILSAALAALYAFCKHRPFKTRWIGWIVLALVVAGLFGSSLVFAAAHGLPNLAINTAFVERLFVVLCVPELLAIIFASSSLLVGLASKQTKDEDREWFARASAWALIIAVAWAVGSALSLFGSAAWALTLSAVTTVIGAVLGRLGYGANTNAGRKANVDISKLPKATERSEIVVRLLLPIFVLLLILALSSINEKLIEHAPRWSSFFPNVTNEVPSKVALSWRDQLDMPPGAPRTEWLLIGIEILICTVATLFVNVNKFSLHGMYRSRLIRTYLAASRKTAERCPNLFTGFDPADNLFMKDLQQKPFHVINMALNLVAGRELAWQQRKAASFTASPLHVGSLWWGYRPVAHYSSTDGGMTLGGAVTISGAAASPNMGYHSSPLLTIVMTLFNARLGAWLGNPGSGGDRTWRKDGPTSGLRSFIDEMFGWTNEKNKWVYLSDGGHFENLGIYEMVLRRCHTIIAVDGSCDKDYKFEDLANAVRKIRIDLGIPVEFRNGINIGGAGQLPQHCAVARVLYSAIDGTDPENDGWLMYIKASLTGDEPADVIQYSKTNPDFPHETTADQWFSESQFESYRALGYHIALQIIGRSGCVTLEDFVKGAGNQPVAAS